MPLPNFETLVEEVGPDFDKLTEGSFDMSQIQPSTYELAKVPEQIPGPVMQRDVPAALAHAINTPITGINALLGAMKYGGQAKEAIHAGDIYNEEAPPVSGEERALRERQALEPFGFNQIRPPESLLREPGLLDRASLAAQQLPVIGPAFKPSLLPYQVEEMRQGPEVPDSAISGIRIGARNVVAPMLTPEGIGMLVAAGVAPEVIGVKYGPKAAAIARQLISGYFGYEGSKGAIEAAPGALQAGVPFPQRLQGLTEAAGSAAIGIGGFKHALFPRSKAALEAAERKRNASSIKEEVAVNELKALESSYEARKQDQLPDRTQTQPQSGTRPSAMEAKQSPSVAWLKGIERNDQKEVSNAEASMLGEPMEGAQGGEGVLDLADIGRAEVRTPSTVSSKAGQETEGIGALAPQKRGWLGQLSGELRIDDARAAYERAPLASTGPVGAAFRQLLNVSDSREAALGARALLNLLSKEISQESKVGIEQKLKEIAYARKNFSPAKIHGFVRSLTQEGARPVSHEVSRPEVLPKAEGRLPEGKAKQGEILLTDEEANYLETERAGIDREIEVVTEPVGADSPFSGSVATIDRNTGKVLVVASEFKGWLKTIAPENRAQAVRSMLSEEAIHLATKEADAIAYWNGLTWIERKMEQRLYTGEWSLKKAQQKFNREFSDTDLGYEASRRRMQRLARMTSTEVAELAGVEKWTVQSIEALQQMISRIMEELPTKGAAERKAILGRIQNNLNVAKAVATGATAQAATAQEDPASLRRKPDATMEMLLPPLEKGQVREAPPSLPRAAGELPVQPQTTKGPQGTAFPVPTMNDISGMVGSFFDEAAVKGEAPSLKPLREQIQGKFGVNVRKDAIYYAWLDGMHRWLANASGNQVEALMDKLRLRQDVARALDPGMTDPKIWKGAIPDVREFPKGERKTGVSVAEFQRKRLGEELKWRRIYGSGQRKRKAAVAAIVDKLTKRAGDAPEKPWSRSTLGPEDISQNYTVAEAAREQKGMSEESLGDYSAPDVETTQKFTIVRPDAKLNAKEFGQRVTKGAASDATGKGAPPRTVTKNVVAVKDASGRITLVSVWKDPRFGPKMTNPDPSGTTGLVISDALLQQYRPVAYMGLREPVQGFRQVFPDVEAFQKHFGDIGIEGTAGLKTSSFAGPEADVANLALGKGTGKAQAPIEEVLPESKPFVSETARELTAPEPAPIEGGRMEYEPRPEAEPAAKLPPERQAAIEAELAQAAKENPAYSWQEPSYGKPTGRIVEYGKPEKMGPGWPLRAGLEGTVTGRRTPAALNRNVAKAAKASASIADKTMVEPLRLYSEWMVDRIARLGGTNAKAFADAANMMITREREIYGELTPVLDPARKLAGSFSLGTMWLHGLKQVTPWAAISRMVGAIEGTLPVPKYAQPIVDVGQAANLEIGKVYQKANPQFKASGKVQRNWTGFGYDLVREGSGVAWKKMVLGNAKANGMKLSKAIGHFTEWKRILDEPGVDAATIDNVNQDFQRLFPKAVTHIKHAGQWQAVIHADLANYLESSARMASHTAAFREFFPPTKAGMNAFKTLTENMRKELGKGPQGDVDALIRALQGHPTDSYSGLGALSTGQPWGEAFRFLNTTIGNLFAKHVLTGQMMTQTGELAAGSTPVFLGYQNYLRALARLSDPKTGPQLMRQMELQGHINRVILDYSFDPHSPVRSSFKIAGNTLSKVTAQQFLNEMQELSAAVTAQVVAQRIKAKDLSRWERSMLPQTFSMMGFNKAQVGEIMRGNADLLAQFESKAASFLTSGNKAIAEGSKIGANRLANSVFRFQAYPMMKANQLRKVVGNFADAMENGTKADKVNATRMLTRFVFGNAAQGAITTAVRTLSYAGLFATGIALKEAADEPIEFLANLFLSSIGGPLQLMWDGSKDKGIEGYVESSSRLLFPYQIAKEMQNFAFGMGPYRDMDLFDKIGKFSRMKVPATRAISNGLAMVGLTLDNKDLDASISAFYRWREKELGQGGTPPLLKNDVRADFKVQMKKAVAALNNGDLDAYFKAREKAAALAEGPDSVKDSLRSHTILKGPNNKKLTQDELYKLKQRIGERAVFILQDYDAMLEATAR